jgi:uncharacterized membrane protein
MTYRIATPGLALVLLVGTAFLGVAAPASAASNATMTACSQQYQADKQANKVPQGVTWSKYYSDCAARMKKGAAATTAAPAATKKKAAATTATALVKKTKTAKAPASPNDTPSFVPQEPNGASQAAVATTDAKGKPLSAGEIAFQQRIHECGNEWQQDKAKGTLPAGEKWPHFWSACNTRLKTHG